MTKSTDHSWSLTIKQKTRKMKNPYSLALLIIMGILLILGSLLAINHNLWGLIPFALGVVIAFGFAQTEPSPRKIGIITVFGEKKPWKVEGLTLLLRFGPIKIVDMVLIPMRQEDFDFKGLENIRCNDGIIISGKGSISVKPDEDDDPPGTPDGKTGAQKLIDYDDAGQMKGTEPLLDDMVRSWVQHIANSPDPTHDSIWMATHSIEIGNDICERISGKDVPGLDNPDLDDARGLGLKIKKIQMNLHRPPNVVKADEEIIESRVMEKRIRERMTSSGLSFNEARAQLIEEEVVNNKDK